MNAPACPTVPVPVPDCHPSTHPCPLTSPSTCPCLLPSPTAPDLPGPDAHSPLLSHRGPFHSPLQTFSQTFSNVPPSAAPAQQQPPTAPGGRRAALRVGAVSGCCSVEEKLQTPERRVRSGSLRLTRRSGMLISNRLSGGALLDLSKQQNLNYQSSSLADKIWIKEPSL